MQRCRQPRARDSGQELRGLVGRAITALGSVASSGAHENPGTYPPNVSPRDDSGNPRQRAARRATLFAVEEIEKLWHGEHRETLPLLTELALEVDKRWLLLLDR